MPGPRLLPLDEFHIRLWTGHFRFYLSLPLERRPPYRKLMKLYLPMLRTIETELELHVVYEGQEDDWYRRRAEAIVPDVPSERSLAVARDVAYYLRYRELARRPGPRRGSRRRPVA
ncbi:MAG: hypothetical protein IRZ11_01650 [Clostridia bacterium]|nr:hypothetical protein [Clostridia bacterium]